MDKESKSFHRATEKEKSIRNISTPQQDGSKKQERDDFDKSIGMRESGMNSPKPEITEKANGSEVALDDPYKQSNVDLLKSQSIHVSQRSPSQPYSDALPAIVPSKEHRVNKERVSVGVQMPYRAPPKVDIACATDNFLASDVNPSTVDRVTNQDDKIEQQQDSTLLRKGAEKKAQNVKRKPKDKLKTAVNRNSASEDKKSPEITIQAASDSTS